jgi:XTP/dITP diphosphohydrolase
MFSNLAISIVKAYHNSAMGTMKKFVFATNNLHKLEEIRTLLGNGYLINGLAEIGCNSDIPEPYPSLEENAKAKADYILEHFKIPCFADDTGLEVDALNGDPGVLSARYAGEEKDSQANMKKLLHELQGITNRKARFRTVIAYATPSSTLLFEGIVEGSILLEQQGTKGFGYDPLFVPDGFSKTFAEMSLDEKNKLSHRARAMNKLIEYLEGIG